MVRQCDKYTQASKLFSNPEDCQSSLSEVVEFIEEATNVKTSRVRPLCDCEFEDKITSATLMKLEAYQEIVEVPYDKFTRIIGYCEEGIAASYHPRTGRIFLIEKEWCFSHLVHEALHSRSTFSRRDPPQKNLEFVSDGLTELLVGLVLKRKIPPCYPTWQIVNSCFSSAYEKFVKPWLYLALKVDFRPIISLYFEVKEQKPLEKLGRLLQKAFNNKPVNMFLNYSPNERGLFDRFKDQLGREFQEDFASFLSSQKKIELDHLEYL